MRQGVLGMRDKTMLARNYRVRLDQPLSFDHIVVEYLEVDPIPAEFEQ